MKNRKIDNRSSLALVGLLIAFGVGFGVEVIAPQPSRAFGVCLGGATEEHCQPTAHARPPDRTTLVQFLPIERLEGVVLSAKERQPFIKGTLRPESLAPVVTDLTIKIGTGLENTSRFTGERSPRNIVYVFHGAHADLRGKKIWIDIRPWLSLEGGVVQANYEVLAIERR